MVVGTKYKIGMFTGIFVREAWFGLGSSRPTVDDLCMEFKDVKIGRIPTWRRFFSPFTTFYQFIPQNVQWKMERRLIGDDNFGKN